MSLVISTIVFVIACVSVSLFFFGLDRAHDEAMKLARANLSPGAAMRKVRMIW